MDTTLLNIFDNDTFQRFKLIKDLIPKYSILKFDVSIKNNIQNIKNNYINYTPNYVVINESLKFEDSNFIDKVLSDEFKKFNKYIQIKESNIDIKISHSTISEKLIYKIYNIVKLFQKLYGEKNIKLYIALCSHKRMISKKIIGTVNVNGGQTDGKIIELFRGEEIIKVICHELIHFYKLDCRNIDNHQDKILDDFKIVQNDVPLSIAEAFTEYLACIHHIALISLYTKASPELIYHYEKIWSLYQLCKILRHYNMKKFEDLYENKFIQGTNVFSYYIIKFFLLWKLDNKCNHKNVIDILNNQDIIKIINKLLNSNQHFDKNLRMTLFELKYF
jgi:hypothetical protein